MNQCPEFISIFILVVLVLFLFYLIIRERYMTAISAEEQIQIIKSLLDSIEPEVIEQDKVYISKMTDYLNKLRLIT